LFFAASKSAGEKLLLQQNLKYDIINK